MLGLCVGDREARADCQCGELIDRIANGPACMGIAWRKGDLPEITRTGPSVSSILYVIIVRFLRDRTSACNVAGTAGYDLVETRLN